MDGTARNTKELKEEKGSKILLLLVGVIYHLTIASKIQVNKLGGKSWGRVPALFLLVGFCVFVYLTNYRFFEKMLDIPDRL